VVDSFPAIRTACGGRVAAADLAPRLAAALRWEEYHTKSPGGVSMCAMSAGILGHGYFHARPNTSSGLHLGPGVFLR
jgi:hypothetical protein